VLFAGMKSRNLEPLTGLFQKLLKIWPRMVVKLRGAVEEMKG
jgi:hypothetical protein